MGIQLKSVQVQAVASLAWLNRGNGFNPLMLKR